jgi:hypothetical protein
MSSRHYPRQNLPVIGVYTPLLSRAVSSVQGSVSELEVRDQVVEHFAKIFDGIYHFFGLSDPRVQPEAHQSEGRRGSEGVSVEHIRERRGESPVRSFEIAHRGDNDLRLFLSESLGICPGVEATWFNTRGLLYLTSIMRTCAKSLLFFSS